MSAGAVVVPRQFGYAVQHVARLVHASPDAQTTTPASVVTPASFVVVPASATPASLVVPPSTLAPVQAPAVQTSPAPHTSHAPEMPHASLVFPVRQTPPSVQPAQVPPSVGGCTTVRWHWPREQTSVPVHVAQVLPPRPQALWALPD